MGFHQASFEPPPWAGERQPSGFLSDPVCVRSPLGPPALPATLGSSGVLALSSDVAWEFWTPVCSCWPRVFSETRERPAARGGRGPAPGPFSSSSWSEDSNDTADQQEKITF